MSFWYTLFDFISGSGELGIWGAIAFAVCFSILTIVFSFNVIGRWLFGK